MTIEHPFAQYVRILGKGPNLSRALTEQETTAAVRMIMSGEIEPVQLGAFLCLLRVKTETPGEVAGFVRGVRAFINDLSVEIDLDWPTYAGKQRQLPWYLLAALLLADRGVRIFMHGTEAHTAGRLYAHEGLQTLGIRPAVSMDEAAAHLKANNFAFLPLESFAPRLQEILALRSLLGVRSPIHTVARQVNPLNASYQVLSVTHPPYRRVHQEAAVLLKQPHMVVFKGEGGEAERRPTKPVEIAYVREGRSGEELWPALLSESAQPTDPDMNLAHLSQLWRGESTDSYATATVIGTIAIMLWLLERANEPQSAHALATAMWAERRRERVPTA
ncbi:Anthranilate phosphoribosyltransferase [invertebrate metagenome]|uniref:Anthranilate phosphoribosyltransferase n=1 Tax=invertebrate metagenome TaxID=1711999 RepID=A0A484H8M2_9ZZZZ